MSLFDLIDKILNREFNRAWSEPHFHVLNENLQDLKTGKTYKQKGRILKMADVPDKPGIYLIRSDYKNNVYVGQSGETQGIRTRLTRHLTAKGSKGLTEGILYEIRWAETRTTRMAQIAEGLAIIYFDPRENIGRDWVSPLKKALQDNLQSEILGEARRLGFLKEDSKYSIEKYIAKLWNVCGVPTPSRK